MESLPVESAAAPSRDIRPLKEALKRGLHRRCPRCGRGRLFTRYISQVGECPCCGLAIGQIRADDVPPYFTILLVGHVVVPAMLELESVAHPATWVHALIWAPVTLLMTLCLLPFVKGAVIGAQWALRIST